MLRHGRAFVTGVLAHVSVRRFTVVVTCGLVLGGCGGLPVHRFGPPRQGGRTCEESELGGDPLLATRGQRTVAPGGRPSPRLAVL